MGGILDDSVLALLVYWRTVKESSGQARKGMAVREYSDGDFIYRAGDAPDGAYPIRTGVARLRGAGPERLFIRDFGS